MVACEINRYQFVVTRLCFLLFAKDEIEHRLCWWNKNAELQVCRNRIYNFLLKRDAERLKKARNIRQTINKTQHYGYQFHESLLLTILCWHAIKSCNHVGRTQQIAYYQMCHYWFAKRMKERKILKRNKQKCEKKKLYLGKNERLDIKYVRQRWKIHRNG